MEKKVLKQYFALLWALAFALSVVFPSHIVLAALNCGPHEVISCEAHDNIHLVAEHVHNVEDVSDRLRPDSEDYGADHLAFPSEEHDTAHQLDESHPSFLHANTSHIKDPCIGCRIEKQQWGSALYSANLLEGTSPSTPYMTRNSFLLFLTSIRLQV